jgi:hypothetical protein
LAPGADGREIVAACAAAEIACERAAVAAAHAASGKGGARGDGRNLLVSYGSLPGSVNGGGSLPSSPAAGSIGAFYPPTQAPPAAFAPLTGFSSACSSPGPPPQHHQQQPPPYGAVPSRMFAQGQYNGSGGNLLMLHQKAQLQSKAAAAFGGGGGGGIGGLRVASASAAAAGAAATSSSPCPHLLAANLSLGGLSAGGQQAVLRVAGLCATLLPPEGGGAAVSLSGGGDGDSDTGAATPDLSRVLEALGLASVFPYLTARLSPGGAAAAAALAAAALAKSGSEATIGSSGGGAAPPPSSSSSSPSKTAAAPTTTSGLASHLAYVSLLNQAVTVGTQLHHDASCQPSHHKYAAHQVALLYQSLNALGGSDRTRPLRRAIESKFDRLKQVTEACARPVLPEDLARWVQRVAWAAREEVRGFPAYAHMRLVGLAGAAKARPTRRGVAAAMAAAARQRQQEQQIMQQQQQQPMAGR